MTRNTICRSMILASAGLLFGMSAWAQQNPAPSTHPQLSADLALTYTAERGQQAAQPVEMLALVAGPAFRDFPQS